MGPTSKYCQGLGDFFCAVYGYKAKEVNLAHYEMFDRKYTKEDNIIDMASLIPCQTVFMPHVARSIYYATMLKISLSLDMNEPLRQVTVGAMTDHQFGLKNLSRDTSKSCFLIQILIKMVFKLETNATVIKKIR